MWASHNSWNHLVWHAKSRLYREALPAFQLPLPLSYTQVLTFSILQNSTTSIPPSLSCFWKWVAASKVTSTLTRNSNFLDLIESATSMLPFPENLTLLSGEGRPQESWLFNFVLVFWLLFFFVFLCTHWELQCLRPQQLKLPIYSYLMWMDCEGACIKTN